MRILINELAEVQKKFGYLPEFEIERIADEHDIPRAHLYGVISFYTRLYIEPKADHIIRICKSVSCGMNSSKELREAIVAHLGVGENMTTPDNRYTLEFVECLGRCYAAPVMTIDDEVFENCTVESAVAIIDSFGTDHAKESEGC